MDKPCEICGNIGFVDALKMCSKCKVTREHLYCMKKIPEEDPEKWVCDFCLSSNLSSSSMFIQNKQPCGTGMRFSHNRPPKKSKVQYLEPEEAKNLVSGTLRNNSPSPRKNRSPMKKPFFSKVTTFPSTAPSPKSSIKPNSSVVSSMRNCSKVDNLRATTDGSARRHCEGSVTTKRVTFGTLPKRGVSSDVRAQKYCLESPTAKQLPVAKLSKDAINSGHSSKLVESLPSVSSKYCLETPTAKQLPVAEISKDAMNSGHRSKLVESLPSVSSKYSLEASTSKQLPVAKLSEDAISSGHTSKLVESPSVSSGADRCTEHRPNNVDSEGTESLNITLVLDRYLPNHPATPPTWKGRFEIKNFGSINRMQVHPPCKVHKNVLMFSKKLPKSIQFEMVPRHNYWLEMFENDVPCELDIGLYFLPSSGHGQGCSSLVMHLDEHDFLLRSVIDEVELFIFSSKHLPEDSRELNQKHFLWGLCRKSENDGTEVDAELVSEDMDVDMLGGEEVGSVDVVLPKPIAESESRGAPPGFSPIMVKEEMTDGTNEACLLFEREIQASCDRFATFLLQREASASSVNTEVKTEPEV